MVFFFWLLLIFSMLIIALHSLKIGKKNIFEPVYYVLLGYFALFVVGYVKYTENISSLVGDETMVYGLFIALMGLLSYYLGYRAHITRIVAINFPKPTISKPGFLMPIGWFFLFVGILGYFYFINASGGFKVFFNTARGAGNYEAVNAYISGSKWLLIPGLAILFLELHRKRYSWFYRFPLFIILALYFLFQIYIGQRSGVLMVGILILALIYLPNNRFKKMPLRNIMIIGFILLLLIGFVSKFRGDIYLSSDFNTIKSFSSKPAIDQIGDLLSVLGGDSKHGSWQNTEISMYFRYIDTIPDKVDYDYGYYFLNYFVWWIPRTVWPDRPDLREEKKVEMEHAIGTSHLSGPSVTMIGFNYMHFGLMGVVFLMWVLGVLFGSLEKMRKLYPDHEFVLLVYLIFFPTGLMDMLGSGFFQSFHVWAPFKLLPLLIVALYIRLFANKRYKWS